MAEFGKEKPTNDGDQVAIVGGLESVSGEAGALAHGGVHGHYHNSLEELSGATAGAAEEVIGGLCDDGYASKSIDKILIVLVAIFRLLHEKQGTADSEKRESRTRYCHIEG